jgi:ABC-type branched-subunit amino acid transport system ATPase component
MTTEPTGAGSGTPVESFADRRNGPSDQPATESRHTRPDGPPALLIEGVQVRFGGRLALDVESMAIPAGKIVGIVGANGAGKTTLFDVISGFINADRGSVRLDGTTELLGRPPEYRAKVGIGRSFQEAGMFGSMTVAETVATALHHRLGTPSVISAALGMPWARRREREIAREAEELIARIGLEPFYDKLINELSTGTRRIVDLACALAQRPRVLLLDEPGSGVAQSEIDSLRVLIRQIREQLDCTLVVIEHDIPLLRGISDVMFALEVGKVISFGTPDEVLTDPGVVAAYLGTDETAIARSGTATGRRAACGSGAGGK